MNRNVLDRVIGWISPSAELSRLKARARVDAVAAGGRREYAGATAGRRAGEWIRGGHDATAEARSAAKRLRESARSLVRDNSYAGLALEVWESHAAPIAARAQVDATAPEAARAANEAIDLAWYEWSRRADFNGLTDFNGLQCLIVRAIKQDGGILVRRWNAPARMRMQVPFQLQLLELDYLDDTRDRYLSDSGGFIRGGIEFDADGRRVAYWIFREHPGSDKPFTRLAEPSVRVPADQILHIFEPLRAGQQLGASSYASVILRTRDIDGYEEAELVRKQTEACIAAFVEDANPDTTETPTVGASVVDSNGDVVETFRPGMIPYLPPGRTVRFNQPSATGGFADYLRTQHRGMAAGLGVPYELMTGDLSQVSFISGRMGLLSFRKMVRKLQNKVLIPQLLDPVWAWFVQYGQATQAIPDTRVWAKWVPPRWESIQPLEDAQADLTDMRSGARTFAQVVTERGGDPADQLREIAENNALMDELEIVLDSDPRNRTKTGNPTETPAAGEPAADEPPPAARVVKLR